MQRSSDSIFPLSIFRDKTFQAREIRRVLMLAGIYLVATTALLGIFYHQMIAGLIEGTAPLFFASEDMQLANEAIPSLGATLGKWIIAMMVLNAFITIALGIYITQKLGHPLMAIKRALREIGDGNLDVQLRASDNAEFGEICAELTSAMHSVREQISAAKFEIANAEEHRQQANDSDDAEAQASQAVHNCRLALDYFETDDNQYKQNKAA